jgi:hypothetical protein
MKGEATCNEILTFLLSKAEQNPQHDLAILEGEGDTAKPYSKTRYIPSGSLGRSMP